MIVPVVAGVVAPVPSSRLLPLSPVDVVIVLPCVALVLGIGLYLRRYAQTGEGFFMLLSRTRRDGDFALECWDCSKNAIDELQLQITPAAGEAKFDAPGGFLFVNWEQSSGTNPTAPQAEE